MGCDSHIYMQKKVKNEWITREYIEVGRDYNLFDIINNVRGDMFKPIAKPCRGAMVEYHIPSYGDIVFSIPEEFGADALRRCKKEFEDEEYMCLGEHSYCTLTVKDLIEYRYDSKYHRGNWHDVEWEELSYIYKKLKDLLFDLLLESTTKTKDDVRYIIGFDS